MTIMRARIPFAMPVTAGAVLALALAGCGGGTQNAAEQDSTSSASSTTSSPSPTATSSSPPVSSKPPERKPAPGADPEFCQTTQLRLVLGKGSGGGTAGTYYRPLRFTNTSDEPCVIQGFAGVSYVAGDGGRQVGPAAERVGEDGPTVTLQPGYTAHADIGFVQVRNYEAAVCEATHVRGLRVYPPQETESLFVKAPGTGCASDEMPGNQLTVATVRPGSA